MNNKKHLSLFILCLGIFLASCTTEPVVTPDEQPIAEDILQLRRSNIDDGGGGEGCEEAGERLDCNCRYRIDWVRETQDTWRLNTQGISTQCCVNNNYVNNVDLTEGCGSFTDITLGVWRQFRCDLGPLTYFRFASESCDNNPECEYPSNTIQFTISCEDMSGSSSSEKTYFIDANTGAGCTNQPGIRGVSLGSDCQLH